MTRRTIIMQARIQNAAMLLSDAMPHLQALAKSTENSGVPGQTLALAHLRASQINGCGVCVDMSFRFKKPDETMERLFAVSAWRDTPYFTEAERAALALTEAVTRLSDHPDPVPDDVWNEAKRHFNESELASLLLHIAVTNVWNRLNVATRQIAGEWAKSADAQKWVDKAQSASR
jgi:alkylhydroperoxidase family enzyme